ncbi:Serine protease, subtilisin family [Sinosporangium album]|uniref:Serine protease, subtilisin family n=1 Tax=Sinosporangium album TaxID=504805 RepID=A0A1G8CI31_9ACTN|nr:Serine protease, subtilisin family [Sinosporangium album]
MIDVRIRRMRRYGARHARRTAPSPKPTPRTTPKPNRTSPSTYRRTIQAALILLPLCAAAAMFRGPLPPPEATPLPSLPSLHRLSRPAQWALGALHVPQVWRHTKGEGVTVAVLDTGIHSTHPDLIGAVIDGPDLTGIARTAHAWGRHGTAMASLIAGRGHGPEHARGVMGVAPAANVLSIRVALESDDPRRQRDNGALAEGIRRAVDLGATVINMSLGGGHSSQEGSAAESAAVRYAVTRGAVLVASAGNDGAKGNGRTYPAAYPDVLAVGAVDDRLRITPYSNVSDYVSVLAPGSGILTATGSNSYAIGDGTSSASAMVAGIAALIRAEYPHLSSLQVRNAIERSAMRRPVGGPPFLGIADASGALAAAAEMAGDHIPELTKGSGAEGRESQSRQAANPFVTD